MRRGEARSDPDAVFGPEAIEALRERAFASGRARLFGGGEEALREAALEAHGCTRRLRGAALRATIERVPPDLRDPFVEELLDIAYVDLPRDSPHVASGVMEILFALDRTALGPDDVLVDVGSGLGKVAMLAELLGGAAALGVDDDPRLVEEARRASAALGLRRCHFERADACDAELGAGTVFYLYAPFAGRKLASFLAKLEPVARSRRCFVCSPPLDEPWLEALPGTCSWLTIYAPRGAR